MKLETEEVYHLVTKPGSKILVFKETECMITYFENFKKKKQFTLLIMSSGHIPRSGIAGSYGIFSFGFLKNHHTDFQKGDTNMHSYQQ